MNLVQVVLNEVWMGWPKDSKMSLNYPTALRLVNQGVARLSEGQSVVAGYQKVRFLSEWMGNLKNNVSKILLSKALELKRRGVVEFIEDEIEMKTEEQAVESKNVEEAPKDKMIKSPSVQKVFRDLKGEEK